MGDIYHAGSTYAGSVPIDDAQTTATNTWSAQKINNEIDTKASKSIITSNDVFDPTKTYAVGDWLIHQGVLYEVLVACTGVTPPNATYYKVKNLHDLQRDVNKFQMLSFISDTDIINNTGRSSIVSNVIAGMVYNPYLKFGIVNIRFEVTSPVTSSSGACLGNWASRSITPRDIRPTVPLVKDSDGSVNGTLYANVLNSNTKIMVYSISTANVFYIAQFPVILN